MCTAQIWEESRWLIVILHPLIWTGVKWLYWKNWCFLLGTSLRLGCNSWKSDSWMGQGLDLCLARTLWWCRAVWGQPRWVRSLSTASVSFRWQPWFSQLAETHIEAVLFCSIFTFLFWGSPPSPFLLNCFLNSVESQTLSPACLEQLGCLWTEWAWLGGTLAGSHPPEGATHLSHLQCWEPGTFNTSSDGCLQPASGTVPSAASPGRADNPPGKTGGHQDPAAPQDSGACWALGALGLQSHAALQLGVGLGVHTCRVCAEQRDKGGEQSSQEIKAWSRAARRVCPLWDFCRQDCGMWAMIWALLALPELLQLQAHQSHLRSEESSGGVGGF